MGNQQLKIIKDNSGVEWLISYLKDKEYVAVDTETTGLTSEARIVGYSVCAEPNVGIYVVTAYWDPKVSKLIELETQKTAPQVMRLLKEKKLIFHNAIFDCAQIENNYKVSLIGSVHTDTMVLAHLLDENRRVGLKELGYAYYGSSAKKEQEEMHASVHANGGLLTKEAYELYKADPDLLGRYGAKDTVLTYNLFYEMIPELYAEGLDKFFYEDECMPLLRGPTYSLNTVGLKVDTKKLADLKKSLEVEILELRAFIYKEIEPHIKDKYPGKTKKTTFNINSGPQLSWLLFDRLENMFVKVSNAGQELCKALGFRTPYNNSDKRLFIQLTKASKGAVWRQKGEVWDKKLRKMKGEAKVKDYWNYLSTDKVVLGKLAKKYEWVEKLLEYKKLTKILGTYVEGIEERLIYGVIHPSFKQTGTTSGRYSSKEPNFQNLPRNDKRVKACIVSRPGKVFVGADYSQLEPRVFASYSQDKRLLECFKSGKDFYSVVGAPIFGKESCSMFKDDPDSFANKYPVLRDMSKVVALGTPYGNTPNKMAGPLGVEKDEAQEIIDNYFNQYPSVKEKVMLEAHRLVTEKGYVESLYGRKRRIPEALKIKKIYGSTNHSDLPYSARTLLNLAVNHRIQSTGASIMNRSAIAFEKLCEEAGLKVRIVMQVHDELIVECDEQDAELVAQILKYAMEQTCKLPGVDLIADPKIANNLADLKG